MTMAMPMRRLRRRAPDVSTPSRTRARMKIGRLKTSPMASSVYATKV